LGLYGHYQWIRCLDHMVLLAFDALWHIDARNFHLVNEALIALIAKKDAHKQSKTADLSPLFTFWANLCPRS
jgi:hypothetical protein